MLTSSGDAMRARAGRMLREESPRLGAPRKRVCLGTVEHAPEPSEAGELGELADLPDAFHVGVGRTLERRLRGARPDVSRRRIAIVGDRDGRLCGRRRGCARRRGRRSASSSARRCASGHSVPETRAHRDELTERDQARDAARLRRPPGTRDLCWRAAVHAAAFRRRSAYSTRWAISRGRIWRRRRRKKRRARARRAVTKKQRALVEIVKVDVSGRHRRVVRSNVGSEVGAHDLGGAAELSMAGGRHRIVADEADVGVREASSDRARARAGSCSTSASMRAFAISTTLGSPRSRAAASQDAYVSLDACASQRRWTTAGRARSNVRADARPSASLPVRVAAGCSAARIVWRS